MSFDFDHETGQSGRRKTDAGLGREDNEVRKTVRNRAEGPARGPRRRPRVETTASQSSRYAELKIQERNRKKKRNRIIAMIVAECITLTAIFSYAYVSRLWNLMPKPSVKEENVTNPNLAVEDIHKMQGYWMIAIFGVDVGKGTSGARGNSSDVNIIACINQDTGDIKLVSLYRDTYLKVTDKGEYRKFNYAYSAGGPEMALKMLNENLDLNITDYIIFNWKAVADGINILGGVDVDITKSEFKFINSFITETVKETGVGSYQLKSAGVNHLDGIQAVSYARLRLMDNDYKRTERQRKIIQLAFDKAKQSDYNVLNAILVTCLPQVMTNLDFVDLTSMALSISKYNLGETAGFPFEKGDANMGPQKGACVIPQSLESNVSQLHQFLFGDEAYQPTSTVRQISQKISSDTGLYAQSRTAGSSGGQSTSDTSEEKKNVEYDEDDEDEKEDEKETTEGVIPDYPGIFETDEDGYLIDPPEPDEDEDEGYIHPGQRYPYESTSAANPGDEDTWTETRPGTPGGTAQPSGTGSPRWPGDTGNTEPTQGPGNTAIPGGDRTTTPGGNSPAAGNGNSNSVTPGGSNTTPGGSNTPGGAATPGGNDTSGGPGVSGGGTGTPGGSSSSPGGAATPGGNDTSGGPGSSGAGSGPLDTSGIITGPGTGAPSDVAAGPGN